MDTPPPSPSQSGNVSDRQWALGIHLSALLGVFVPTLSVIAPLIIWLIKKSESPSLDAVGKRVLNFQISYLIYGYGLGMLAGLLMLILIGWLLLPVVAIVGVAWLVFTIIGAVKESNGEVYQAPFVIKFFQ